MLIKLLFRFSFIVLILFVYLFYARNINAQACFRQVLVTCDHYQKPCQRSAFGDYECKVTGTDTESTNCVQIGTRCVSANFQSSCQIKSDGTGCSIINCGDVGGWTNIDTPDCYQSGGGTTPTITSTPTPTPTPTPAPAGGGVDCGTCKRGGESCSGSGSKCCSGVCKKDGTCKGNGGCGGGGGTTPTNTPTPRPPTATPFIPPMATPTPTATPLPTATPTPVPLPWYKLKDASLVGNTSINSPIPVSPLTPYDADDPGNRYLIDNSAGFDPGVATGQNISIGGATVSSKGWKVTGKSYSPQLTVQKFIDYVKSKKTTLINNGSIVSNKINILSGNQTISEADLSGKRPLMVIVEGNVTLTGTTLNSLNEQQLIMATGTITFPATMSVANGLYVGDTLDFGTTANQGIKIIGNIIAQSSFSNARQWSNGKKPGLFIVFDPSHYIGMLDMLSTITYDWRQIQ